MKKALTNDQISARYIRLVVEGKKPERMGFEAALHKARAQELDLVQVSPTDDDEPICKILDYGKMLYSKKKQQSKSATVKNETKELRLSFNISEHDMDVKSRKAQQFLSKHARVKVNLQMKGRQVGNSKLAMEKLLYFAGKLVEFGTIETKPTVQGRSVFLVLKPLK